MEENKEEELTQSQRAGGTPTGGNSKAILAVLVTVVVLIIAQLIATGLLFSAIEGIETGGEDEDIGTSFASFIRGSDTSATLTFSEVRGNPEADDIIICLSNGSAAISYTLPSFDDGAMLIPSSGWIFAPPVHYIDVADNQRLDEGDALELGDLDPRSGYEIHLILGTTGTALDSISLLPLTPPSVTFCGVEVTGTSSATVTFCQFEGRTDPFDLTIILENPVNWGAYVFQTKTDGTVLTRYSGSDMATITYRDLSDDGEIKTGDYLGLTGLSEGTEYTIRIYAHHMSGEADHRTFTTPITGSVVTSGSFASVFDTSETTATAIFGSFMPAPPQPIRLVIILWRDGLSGSYNFQDNENGTILTLFSGMNLGTLTYIDHADNQLVDVGDEIRLSGLEEGEDYVIILVWGLTGDPLDFEVFSTPDSVVPTGMWMVEVISNTAADAEFGPISPNPQPTSLRIVLERNLTDEAVYVFTSDDDGPLVLLSGPNLGTLTYADLADNQKINTGDEIRMTDLSPNSDYVIKMIWEPTGDQIDSAYFTTPA